MTSSNGNIFRVTGPLCGEFTGPGEFPTQRAVTRNFDVFFDLRLNKRLSKQPRGWWFETPSWSFWRQCHVPKNSCKAYIDGLVQGCIKSIANIRSYCSLSLSHWYVVLYDILSDVYINVMVVIHTHTPRRFLRLRSLIISQKSCNKLPN